MLPPLPRCSSWAYSSLISPSRVSLPRKGRRVGLHIDIFEACSAFTRVAACTLALSPIRDTLIEGFSHLVTSMTAPIASGWSESPGGACTHWKAPPCHGAPPMQPLDEPEGRFRPSLGAGEQPSIEEQRLGDEEHLGEQQPHSHHRVHPPVFHREKAVPQIEPNDHVQTGEPGKRCGNARLIAKPPFCRLEEDNPLRRGLEISHRQQKYRCHAADPEDDEKNVKCSGERYVIHRDRAQFG